MWMGLNNIAFGLELSRHFKLFSARGSSKASSSAKSGTGGAIPTPPSDCGKESTVTSERSGLHKAASTFPAIGAWNLTIGEGVRHFLSQTIHLPSFPRTQFTWTQDWWRKSTTIHRRLSPVIFPFFAKRVQTVANCVPSAAERVSPYINPSFSFWMALKAMQPNRGKLFLSSALKASMVMGSLCMVRDVYVGGLGSRDLTPRNDSYAVVTG